MIGRLKSRESLIAIPAVRKRLSVTMLNDLPPRLRELITPWRAT
jgi:hypothetical protein